MTFNSHGYIFTALREYKDIFWFGDVGFCISHIVKKSAFSIFSNYYIKKYFCRNEKVGGGEPANYPENLTV